LADAIAVDLQAAASTTSAQVAPSTPVSLFVSANNFAASLKASFPDLSIALLPQPFWWWQSGIAIDALLTYGSTIGDKQDESLL
jgi:mannan endo-1,6-alpha-mannosidase